MYSIHIILTICNEGETFSKNTKNWGKSTFQVFYTLRNNVKKINYRITAEAQ